MADEPNAAPSGPSPGSTPPRQARDPRGYWYANLRLIGMLLAVWATVSFGSLLFAEQLNAFKIGQLPLGFWMVQQGAIYVFVVLIFVYAWRMDVIDRQFGVEADKTHGAKDEGTKPPH